MIPGSHYTIQRDFWSVFERKFRVFDADGRLRMFVKHPIFKLREEFVVSEDEEQQQPLLRIKSRRMVAVNHVFEITDASSGAVIGSVQKRGIRSIVRDRFELLGPDERVIGYMEEQGAALLRRFIPLLTSKHAIFLNDIKVASINQRFRWFTKEFDVELHSRDIDQRYVLACALLALIAEARREDRANG